MLACVPVAWMTQNDSKKMSSEQEQAIEQAMLMHKQKCNKPRSKATVMLSLHMFWKRTRA